MVLRCPHLHEPHWTMLMCTIHNYYSNIRVILGVPSDIVQMYVLLCETVWHSWNPVSPMIYDQSPEGKLIQKPAEK